MANNNAWNSAKPATADLGGTGQVTLPAHTVLVGNLTGALSNSGTGSAGQILLSGGASADPAYVTPTTTTGLAVTTNASTLSYALTVPVVVSNGGTGVITNTAYGVKCAGSTSTGAWQEVPGVGATNQVLVSNGSGFVPTWQGAALVKLSTITAANQATVSFTSLVTSTYKHYYATWSGMKPITNSSGLRIKFSTDNGSSYVVTGYNSGDNHVPYNSTIVANNSVSTFIQASPGSNLSSSDFSSGSIWIFNLSGASGATQWIGNIFSGTFNSGAQTFGEIAAATYNALQFFMSSGNISVGVFTLYGIVS